MAPVAADGTAHARRHGVTVVLRSSHPVRATLLSPYSTAKLPVCLSISKDHPREAIVSAGRRRPWCHRRLRLRIDWGKGADGTEAGGETEVEITLSRPTRSFFLPSLPGGKRWLLFRERAASKHFRLSLFLVPEFEEWMAALPDATPLTSLYLPGTHESMAIHGFPISSCQTFPISRQLEAGMRFIDLRFALKDGILVAYHGLQPQYLTAEEAFGAVYAFLDAHPSETVIVSVKQENRMKGFEDAVWDLLDRHRAKWYDKNLWPTLGEVRGKAIMFCRYGFNSQRGLHPAYWPDNTPTPWESEIGGHTVVVQDWYSIGSFVAIPEKAALVLSLFRPARCSVSGAQPLRINFASGATLITAFPFVVAKGVGAPALFGLGVKGVNARVLEGLLREGREEKAKGDGGMILLLDYYESPGGLAELMIAWNFIDCSP